MKISESYFSLEFSLHNDTSTEGFFTRGPLYRRLLYQDFSTERFSHPGKASKKPFPTTFQNWLFSCVFYDLKVSFLSSGEPMALLGPSTEGFFTRGLLQKDSLPEGLSTEGFFTRGPLYRRILYQRAPLQKDSLPEGFSTEGFFTRELLYRRILYQRPPLQKDSLPEGPSTEGFFNTGPLYRRILYQRASLQKDSLPEGPLQKDSLSRFSHPRKASRMLFPTTFQNWLLSCVLYHLKVSFLSSGEPMAFLGSFTEGFFTRRFLYNPKGAKTTTEVVRPSSRIQEKLPESRSYYLSAVLCNLKVKPEKQHWGSTTLFSQFSHPGKASRKLFLTTFQNWLLSCVFYYLKVSFLSSGEPMALLGPSRQGFFSICVT